MLGDANSCAARNTYCVHCCSVASGRGWCCLTICMLCMLCIDMQLLGMTTMPCGCLSGCWSIHIAHISGMSRSLGMPSCTSSTWWGCQPSSCGGGRSGNSRSDRAAAPVVVRSIVLPEGHPGDAVAGCPIILGPVCSFPLRGAGVYHAGYVHSLSA